MELTERRPAGRDWRKWSSTRQGTLAIAAACTLVAAGILIYALSRYRHNVNAKGAPATVLVATQLIEQGTAGDAIGVGHLFRPARVRDRQVTPGAFADPAALHGEVAVTDIYPGQQLTVAEFAPGGLVSRLASSQRAIAVPLDASHGLIGELQAGDHVDVYVSFQGGLGHGPVLRLLAPNVEVLKASKAAEKSALGATSGSDSVAVLEVNTKQAAEIAFAVDNGKLWLTLRPGKGTPPRKEVVSEASILLGSPTGSLEGTK